MRSREELFIINTIKELAVAADCKRKIIEEKIVDELYRNYYKNDILIACI